MAETTMQTGPRLPTQDAINILNQNAQAASERARYATAVQDQSRVGRDALRRDATTRAPIAGGDIPGYQPVPPDQTPARTPSPTAQLQNLVSQFTGQGRDATGGGGVGGSGAGGHRTSIGARTPNAPPSGGGDYQTNGVYTVTGEASGNQLAHVAPANSTTAPAAPSGPTLTRSMATMAYWVGRGMAGQARDNAAWYSRLLQTNPEMFRS